MLQAWKKVYLAALTTCVVVYILHTSPYCDLVHSVPTLLGALFVFYFSALWGEAGSAGTITSRVSEL
jgi:hypothetical protein